MPTKLLLSLLLLALGLPCGVAAPAGTPAHAPHANPVYVLVAGPPRMGTTWLFNAVRLLVRYHDPNVISGFETAFGDRDLCYWKSRNVSMVVKTHALHKGFMVGAQCASGEFLTGFDTAVTSFRDPFDTGCSLVKKDGKVQKEMCEKVLCEQHAFYHPPQTAAHTDPVPRPLVVYEMDFRDLQAGLVVEILEDLAAALGLHGSLMRASSSGRGAGAGPSDSGYIYHLIAHELSLLRPLGDPVHSLRSAQHPVTLMHSNHVGRKDKAVCDADPGLNAMKKNPLCHALAENGGRQSDALWTQFPGWKGRCARLRKLPQPQSGGKKEL